ADLLHSPKRTRSPQSTTDLEVSLAEISEPSRYRGTDLEIDVDVERNDGLDIDPEIQAKINECITYADALRARGIDARVVVEAVDREEIEARERGLIKIRVDRVTHPVIGDDTPESAQEGFVEAIESVQVDQGHKIMATGQQSNDMLGRIHELEWDNRRLRDMMDVARALGARATARNLEPLIRDEGEEEEVSGDGGNGNGGNGNGGNEGNGNRGNRNGGNENGENGN
ncbi:hypothetical protein Tco_1579193, partial [Tanacetum coccineum]